MGGVIYQINVGYTQLQVMGHFVGLKKNFMLIKIFIYFVEFYVFIDMYGGLRGGMGGGGGGGGGGVDPAWPDLGNTIPNTFKSRFISSSSKEDDKSSKSKRYFTIIIFYYTTIYNNI